MSLNSSKKMSPRKLHTKQPKPISDDGGEESVPATPSLKSKKKSTGTSEQRLPASPPKDDVSQASGSQAPLGRGASERPGKAKEITSPTKDITQKGEETLTDTAPLDLSALKGLNVAEGGQVLDQDGNPVGRVVEGDPEDLVGQTIEDEGEIVDEDGDLIGRVDILNDAADQSKEVATEGQSKLDHANDVVTNLAELDGLPVSEGGVIKNAAGQAVGKIIEGDSEDLIGYTLNDEGEVIDDEGDPIGRAELIPIEEQQEALEETTNDAIEKGRQMIPSIESLEGLKCNKRGYIMDEANEKPVGEIIEGDPKRLSKLGAELDAKGQFWDNRGNIIGKAKPIPVEDDQEEGPFSHLEGLVVGQDGWIEDENQTRVGRLIEGDAKKLVGRAVDEDGDVLDRHGNVIARSERWEEPEAPAEEPIDMSSMDGLSCNKAGYVIGPEGFPIGRVIEGDPKQLAGKKIEGGEIYDGKNIVGRVELIPEDEQESIPGGVFAGMEDLVVTQDGFVEDENGYIVGQLIEGDAKKLRGHAVDEDGEITDKYGNVKGRAEPYEPPEEEPPTEEDLSILEGKVVNKQGNIVDPTTGAVFGRVVEGDKRLAGCKVDGQGQIWGDNGKVVGRGELIPGAEQEEEEGPFYGFDNAEVGKDGVVVDGEQIIGRLVEGDAKRLLGRKVDEDGDVLDKNGNIVGKAERWEPEEKQRDVNPMAGRKVTKEGEVRDADGNLIGKLTSGNLPTLVGKIVDDNGYVVDNDGNKIGECTLLEYIQEELSPEEKQAQEKEEQDRQLAQKMCSILSQTLEQVKPICSMITQVSFSKTLKRLSLTSNPL